MRRGNELLGNVDHVLADLHVIARIAADSRSIRRIELPGPSRAASPFRLSRQADPHPNAANLFVYRASVIVIVARAGEKLCPIESDADFEDWDGLRHFSLEAVAQPSSGSSRSCRD